MKNCFLFVVLALVGTHAFAKPAQEKETLARGMNGKLSHIGRYSVGSVNEDGGIAEIVQYNKDNQRIYLVNGALGSLDIVDVRGLRSGSFTSLGLYRRINISAMGDAHGFVCGDLTSAAIGVKNKVIALAVQQKDYAAPGYIVLLDYEGAYLRHYGAGVQPDMICFAGDEQYILTADEGEPREGYGGAAIDPPGSVTILNLSTNEVKTVGFDAFDEAGARAALIEKGAILGAGAKPSLDFEPEYIAVGDDNRSAWVSLQEANAIAVLDIPEGAFSYIAALGFKDHNIPTNSLDALKDKKAELAPQNLYGAYMPDGIAAVNIQGTTYVLTANEGDAREWGSGDNEYADIDSFTIGKYKMDVLDNTKKDGLESGRKYLLGARSFSIWEARGPGVRQIYDSGNDFETITAGFCPENFNASHGNNDLDSRSGKKGPEPEYVAVLPVGNRFYGCVGLERIGGVMVYDISNPASPVFYDYINTRDFSASGLAEMGDLGPEGLCAVKATDSPTGRPLLFAANEVSGTIAVYEFGE
ncbi:MAG: choice-of-anchor I family protein [Treponema sp.]|jgi:hypothetical protein|nr:choice-of-anchor I family protein [Treponema sp.]